MQPMRIAKLEIDNIGPFEDLTLEFPNKPAGTERKAEIHILTGENGTGKTTILEIMANLIDTKGAHASKLHYKFKQDLIVSTSIYFDNRRGDLLDIGEIEHHKLSYLRNMKDGKEEHSTPNILFDFTNNAHDASAKFSYAFFAYSGHRKVSSVGINGIKEIDGRPFSTALDFQKTADPNLILQWIANTISAEAIAQVQEAYEEAQQRRQAIRDLEKAISSIINKPLSFKLETKPYAVKVDIDGERLAFDQLPDGLKSILSWLADLLMRMDRVKWENDIPVFERNFILFLDEIEIHMHPVWQRKILPAVQGLFPNAQIIVSTHSPFIVGSVDSAWIHKLVRINGGSYLSDGYPMRSEDAKSYRYWLEEVFDVNSEYGLDADKQLQDFYSLRNDILKGSNGSVHESIVDAGRSLANQSQEIRQIIEMELRQINRRMNLQLHL